MKIFKYGLVTLLFIGFVAALSWFLLEASGADERIAFTDACKQEGNFLDYPSATSGRPVNCIDENGKILKQWP